MLIKYITHNGILVIICSVALVLYTLNENLLYRNMVVFFAVVCFVIANIFFHKKHLHTHSIAILEYILIGLMVFLIHLLLLLFRV